jgi:hypothetical protein
MSVLGQTKDQRDHLRLAVARPDPAGRESHPLVLPASPRLQAFVAESSAAGLDVVNAVRLALERSLAIMDASLFGVDVVTARRLLGGAARRARPERALTPTHAAYVRELTVTRPRQPTDVSDGLRVTIPERVLVRARGEVRQTALRPAVVGEMVAWEVAATFAGRTMGEWALATLAGARRRIGG